jgi:hypothetical protein
LKRLYELRNQAFVVNESDPLRNLEAKSYKLRVLSGQPQLCVCMTYADLPGNPADAPTEPERVNDLSLRVTAPDGTLYWGNAGLSAGRSSVAGGAADSINTVECVFVPNPPAGTWTVEVLADELRKDGRVETPEIDADFGLVVLGIQPPQPPILALCGQRVQLHLYKDIGTAVRCESGCNTMDRLQFEQETDLHWIYKSTVHRNRLWAVSKADQCRAIWLFDPDHGVSQWKVIDYARTVAPNK